MSSEVFRRVGRGGAGNFYSQQDIQDIEKKAEGNKDLEAQNPTTANTASTIASIQATGPVYTKAGRGGAGNIYKPGTGADEGQNPEAEAERTRAAVSAHATKPKTVLSGRGGVGNWTDTAVQAVDEEQKRQANLEAKIVQDVEAGLAMPPKTYHQSDREQEK